MDGIVRRGGFAGVVAALGALALALAGCTSGGGGSNTPPSATTTTTQAAPAATISISGAGGGPIAPKTPIVVTAKGGTLTSVTVTNPGSGTKVSGALSADKLTWTSNEPLGYGVAYQVVADAVNKDGKSAEQKGTVQTVSPAVQTFPAMIPAPTTDANASFGVGQIIGVSFDHDVDKAAAEKTLTVTTTPPQPGSWYWLDNRTAHYRAQNYWQAGTTIKLDIADYGVDLGNGVYGKTDRSATYKIHDSWVAKADGNTKQMQILHNGQEVKTLPISLGKDSTPTHVGPHVISDRQQQVVMDSCTYGVCPPDPNAYKATEYFDERISNDGEFVHENPNTVNQQGSVNVSHGCINLSPENAEWFFNTFNLGDVVEVANSGGPTLPLYDTYGDWELSWDQWQKGSAAHG